MAPQGANAADPRGYPRGELVGVRFIERPIVTVRTAERRRSVRSAAAHPYVLRDRKNRPLARGRTANISENGVLIVVRNDDRLPQHGQVILDITVPADPLAGTTRMVKYRGRIVRRQSMGNMLGLGLEFLQKLK